MTAADWLPAYEAHMAIGTSQHLTYAEALTRAKLRNAPPEIRPQVKSAATRKANTAALKAATLASLAAHNARTADMTGGEGR